MSLLKRPRSVRARLTLAYVAAMVAVLGVYAGVVYMSVRSSMSTALDEKLRYDLSWPKDMIFKDSVRGLLNGEWMNDPVRIQESTGGPWLQVWSADGETLLFATPEARINLIPHAAQLAKTPDRKIRTLSDMVRSEEHTSE